MYGHRRKYVTRSFEKRSDVTAVSSPYLLKHFQVLMYAGLKVFHATKVGLTVCCRCTCLLNRSTAAISAQDLFNFNLPIEALKQSFGKRSDNTYVEFQRFLVILSSQYTSFQYSYNEQPFNCENYNHQQLGQKAHVIVPKIESQNFALLSMFFTKER